MAKVVLITGASSGIGAACAHYFSKNSSYKVYGTSRKESTETAFEMLKMDVTDSVSINTAIAYIVNKEKQIDIVVNNAGIGITGAIEDCSNDELQMQLNTNFFGVVNVNRVVVPIMRTQQRGLIINISSLGGRVGMPFNGAYSAAKFALEAITEAQHIELKPFNINVVCLCPSDIVTPITYTRYIVAKTQQQPPYAETFKGVYDIIISDELKGAQPIMVAKKIEKIIEKKSPKVRYFVGKWDQIFLVKLKSILPSKLFFKIVELYYKL